MEDIIREKLNKLPSKPGVYEMYDGNGKIIYVGKAKNLKNRVKSYFLGAKELKTKALVENIEDLSWTITNNEVEALILECNLIKEYTPKYNILLRDDKHYPYIKVNVDNDFPTIKVVRRRGKDKALYFGPFISTYNMNALIRNFERIFKIRTCSDRELNNRVKPCINYQIKKCDAPCVGYITKEEYKEKIKDILLILDGKEKILITKLKEEMERYSSNLQFEKALMLRDEIKNIEGLLVKQVADNKDLSHKNIIGLYNTEFLSVITIVNVKDGKIIRRDNVFLKHRTKESDQDVIEAFLVQYYNMEEVPKELLLPVENIDESTLNYLNLKRDGKVNVIFPKRGEKLKLLELANNNAKEASLRDQSKRELAKARVVKGLNELKEVLHLEEIPKRIECYDISNISGTNTVASMVVFQNGIPEKKEYRKFKIRTVEGPNDFDSMKEVMSRRFQNYINAEEKFKVKPDLIVIDGGKGQLSSSNGILENLGVEGVKIVGLAKKEEIIYEVGDSEGIKLHRDSPGLNILVNIRDEAHRFAITFHRKLRDDEMVKSIFTEIEGIGPKRKKELIKAFGSVKGIRNATVEEVYDVLHNMELAKRVKDYIN